MKKVAYIFPGQGSQYAGMGKDLYDRYRCAKEIYDFAGDLLKIDIKKLCFEGALSELLEVYNSQIAMLVTDIAYFSVLEECRQDGIDYKVVYLAGHSLGELAALYAGSVLSYRDVLLLCDRRAKALQKACTENKGGMLAVFGLEKEEVQRRCEDVDKDNIFVANINGGGQIIISGLKEALEKFVILANKENIKVKMLSVQGPFHSKFMYTASLELKNVVERLEFSDAKIPIVTNTEALPITNKDKLKECVVKQVHSQVLWEDIIRYMAGDGIDVFVEVGPGEVLSKLVKRIIKSAQILHAKEIIYKPY